MNPSNLRSRTIGLLAAVALVSSVIAWKGTLARGMSDTAGSDASLTVAVSTVGDFSKGNSWFLSVNSAGQAELSIDAYPSKTRRRFVVPEGKLKELRNALDQQRFFDLADRYGEEVPDSSHSTITITAGDRSKSVRLSYLMNWVAQAPTKLREPARAVRIAMIIRGWFDDSEAVDLRPYDRKVLDAIKE